MQATQEQGLLWLTQAVSALPEEAATPPNGSDCSASLPRSPARTSPRVLQGANLSGLCLDKNFE